jgi:hypothetical protein
MLPDEILNDYREQARLHFGDDNPELMRAVEKLADAGWTWDSMRSTLALVYNAGHDAGYREGCEDSY